MSWTLEITVQNKTDLNYRYKIKKGQVFENKQIGTGYQNVAAIQDYQFILPPKTTSTVSIEVLCINEKLKPPSGFLNLTPYMISKDFLTQQDLWEIMRTI